MGERLLVVLLGVAFFGVTVTWSFAAPISSAVDDDFHLPSIWCARECSRNL